MTVMMCQGDPHPHPRKKRRKDKKNKSSQVVFLCFSQPSRCPQVSPGNQKVSPVGSPIRRRRMPRSSELRIGLTTPAPARDAAWLGRPTEGDWCLQSGHEVRFGTICENFGVATIAQIGCTCLVLGWLQKHGSCLQRWLITLLSYKLWCILLGC